VTLYIAPIVEGQTEVSCVEPLFHRIWVELLAATDRLQVLPATRVNRDALVMADQAVRKVKVEEAHVKVARHLRHDPSGRGVLFLLLDAESDCPAKLAPTLLKAAIGIRSDTPIACVLAKRMIENWIVAGASTLGGVNGLPSSLPPRNCFEDLQGARWLETQLRSQDRSRKYKKSKDAKVFVRQMDLAECRGNSPSFAKFCRELEALHAAIPTPDETPADDAAPDQDEPQSP
jgi:hypothetical protein